MIQIKKLKLELVETKGNTLLIEDTTVSKDSWCYDYRYKKLVTPEENLITPTHDADFYWKIVASLNPIEGIPELVMNLHGSEKFWIPQVEYDMIIETMDLWIDIKEMCCGLLLPQNKDLEMQESCRFCSAKYNIKPNIVDNKLKSIWLFKSN